MNINKKALKWNRLEDFVDHIQSSGRYSFVRGEAQASVSMSAQSLKKALQRLVKKQRIAVPRKGFYIIVPLEYRTAGAPPASWFIDAFMKHHGVDYYVGLLSAAAIHGSAHQQPQEFQVVSRKQLKPILVGRSRIRFFTKKDLNLADAIEVKTETGTMRVSTPEMTAFDLVRYMEGAGHLNHVATVLSELIQKLDIKKFVSLAKNSSELPVLQRLGFLLDQMRAKELSNSIQPWLAKKHPTQISLRPDKPSKQAKINLRWNLRMNETIEMDNI